MEQKYEKFIPVVYNHWSQLPLALAVPLHDQRHFGGRALHGGSMTRHG
jgi:hypothetical protein